MKFSSFLNDNMYMSAGKLIGPPILKARQLDHRGSPDHRARTPESVIRIRHINLADPPGLIDLRRRIESWRTAVVGPIADENMAALIKLKEFEEYLGKLNIKCGYSQEYPPKVSWRLEAIKTFIGLLDPEMVKAPIVKGIYFHGSSAKSYLMTEDAAYGTEEGIFFPCPSSSPYRKMVLMIEPGMANYAIKNNGPLGVFALVAHEFGHYIIRNLLTGPLSGKIEICMLTGGISRATDDYRVSLYGQEGVESLFDQAVRLDSHYDFLIDFMSLYLLAGTQLRGLILGETNRQFKGMANLYELFKEAVFQGKEFT